MSLKKKLEVAKRKIESQDGGWDAHLDALGYKTVTVRKGPPLAASPTKGRKTGPKKKKPVR